MSSRSFLGATLASIVALAALVIGINWRIDLFGVLRDAHGRHLHVASDDRATKYLYAFNYVPSNFDAILVGNSLAMQVDPSLIHGVRMYNAGLGGANATEMRTLAETSMSRGSFKLLLVALDPNALKTHGPQNGGMEPAVFWTALGSTQLFTAYAAELSDSLRHVERYSDLGHYIGVDSRPPVATADYQNAIQNDPDSVRPPPIDEAAFRDLEAMLVNARARGTRVAGYTNPFYAPRYRAFQGDFDAAFARMKGLFKPGETIVDFNDGSFAQYTERADSFVDRNHMRRSALTDLALRLDSALNGPPVANLPR